MKRLAKPDPVALLVGALIEIAAGAGLIARLELTGVQVAQIGGGLIMLAAAIRMMVARKGAPDG